MADSIGTFVGSHPANGKGNSGSFWPSWAQGNFPGKGTQNPSPAAPAPAGPTPATGNNPSYPNNPATQYMGQPRNPGDQHPYSNDPWTMLSPQAAPGAGYSNFLPSVFRDPYLGSMNAASQVGTAAGMALPNAAAFQSDLYGPGLTGMEQSFMRSAGDQGLRGLNQTLNRVEAQFENAPMHGALGAMSMDAANQFATNMMNMGSQMGTQRQNTAAGTLGTTFQLPLQAGQQSQEAASGLYNMMTQAMYGDMQYPTSMYNSYPFIAPTISQPTGGGKG